MNSPEATWRVDSQSWNAIRAAMARGEARQADALFMGLFRRARRDADALAEYGLFCLHTGRPTGARYLLYRAHVLDPEHPDARCHLGHACLTLRLVEQAKAHFLAVLARWPVHAQAHHGLGQCRVAEHDFAGAATAFADALASTPPEAALPLLVRAAEAFHRSGDDARARALFTQACTLAPDHPALRLAHARFLRASGQPAQALVMVDGCLAQDPNEPRLLLEKARCLRLLGQIRPAHAWLERLGQIAPSLPEGAEEAGNCLLEMGQTHAAHELWVKAIDGWTQNDDLHSAQILLERLLADDPRHAGGWNARGTLASLRQDEVGAEAAWRQAMACDPDMLAAPANLASLLENRSRLDAARAVAESALARMRPGLQSGSAAGLLLALARVERRQHAPARGLALLDRPEAAGSTDTERATVELERGKLLQALGRNAEAMAAFTSGNAAAARAWLATHPGGNTVVAGLDQVLRLSASGWWRQLPPIPHLPAHPPIAFLLGFPRSGTTLLNTVLDTHPAICTMDELPVIARVVEAFRDIPGGYPLALAQMDAIDVQWLRGIYLDEAHRLAAPRHGQLLLDKFPTSTVLAGMLHRIFPQARFVFALRHPCDVLLSCFMQGFQLSDTMFNFCTLADTVALYTRTMDLWQVLCEQLPLQVHTIRYEDVVEDFDGQVGALCEFLGVHWQDEMREFAAKAHTGKRIKTPSYEQVVRPIYREARYRWEQFREFLEPFLPTLEPYIRRFGYATTTPPAG